MRKSEPPVFDIKLLSSLAKVFADEEPKYQTECLVLTALKDETVSFQAAVKSSGFMKSSLNLKIHSPVRNLIRVRTVEYVPVGRPTAGILDDNYLRTESGMYPDLLRELKDGKVTVFPSQWRSIWFDICVDETAPAGMYPIEIELTDDDGETVCSAQTHVTIYDVILR